MPFTYLCLFEAVFGRQTPGAVQAVDTPMRRCGAQAIFGGRAGRKNRNRPREERRFFPLGRWDERRRQCGGDGFLLQSSVNKVHRLQGPEGKDICRGQQGTCSKVALRTGAGEKAKN